MTFKPFIIVALMVISVSCLTVFAPFAFADGNQSNNQSNQNMNQPSVLVAPEPNFEIDVYPKPGTDKQRVGYGVGGDQVTVLEQVGSNEGYTWNYVQFAGASALKGWIREEFVVSELQKGRQSQNGSNQRSDFQPDQSDWGDRQNQQQDRGNQRQAHYSQQQND